MRAVLVLAVLASCSCSKKKSTCEDARAVYLAEYQKRVDGALASVDLDSRTALETQAAVELKMAREGFVSKCTSLDGAVFECVERMVKENRLVTRPPCSERLQSFFDSLYDPAN